MKFSDAEFLTNAERATGLTDWGGDEYFEREFRALLAAMTYSLENESRLHTQGRRGAELRLAGLLEARLGFVADRSRWPEIKRERIERPMFILGLPRSGSTFLHTLMAQDPANRVPPTWEMMFPSASPVAGEPTQERRIARAESILTAMGLQHAAIRALHPFGARQPEECHLMMEMMLLGDNLPASWRMPAYNKQRANTDLLLGYRTHRMVLQNLQHRDRRDRVMLKNPGHLFYLSTLLEVYPDALLVQTHRDPVKVIPSVAALLVAMRTAASDDVPPASKIALGNLRAFADGLVRGIEFRKQPGKGTRFFDVHFRQLIAKPIETVRQIYQQFGIELSAVAEAAMRRWLADPANRSPKGQHLLTDCGLDEAAIDDAFGAYMTHYGIERERESELVGGAG